MTEHERDYSEQTAALKRFFEPVMTEPIPARMYLRRPAWIGHAKAASILAVGVALGVALSWSRPVARPVELVTAAPAPLPARAARAHLVYSPEVRHPVEVDAAQQDHLVQWLSKRLDFKLKVPVLAPEGYELLGGRLLPGPDGPVAHFMYQDASGKRLTLYVARRNGKEQLTAFRYAQEGPVSVFYWVDRDCGYALSGEIDKAALSHVADAVYRQLEP
jgi:anti-sigma factor RsiW